jgi:hypothetical protein
VTIDDRLEKSIEIYSKELDPDLFKKVTSTVIDQIPHYGTQINKILFGDAQRRVAERAADVFNAVKDRVERIEDAKIDKEFLKSDEFMTILILAIEQLQTTHDKGKIEMIANAVANSGVLGFSTDSRKELFMRILRDLAPEHAQTLKAMLPRPIPRHQGAGAIPIVVKAPRENELAILQNLAAHGLVEESYEKPRPSISISGSPTRSEVKHEVEKLLMDLPTQCFRLNRFGEDFLRFFGADGKPKPIDEA